MNDNPSYPQHHVFNNQLMVFGSRNPNVLEYWDGTKWQIASGQALTKLNDMWGVSVPLMCPA